MRVSAIVLSFNGAKHLEPCVTGLVECFAENPEPSEILVVENGSHDDSPARLRALADAHPDVVRPIYLDVNHGTTRSRNRALREARGRYLLVLDLDARMTAPTLERLIERVDADRRCGIAVPQLTYPDGRFQLSYDTFPTLTRKIQRFFGLRGLEAGLDGRRPVEPMEVDYAISAAWLMRRDVVDRVGLLDEAIFYAPEDVDYCLRVWEAGLRIVYDPGVSAVHDAQELSRGGRINRFTIAHAKGLLYYFWKHRYCFGLGRLYRRLGRKVARIHLSINERPEGTPVAPWAWGRVRASSGDAR